MVQHFSSDGVDIAYRDAPAAGPATGPPAGAPEAPRERLPVLLIHGFASNAKVNWVDTGWFETLTRAGTRTIAYDNRGHGLSEKLYRLEDYGAPVMAEDARRLLDHLGLARVHVMGYSMGARIAAFLALAHPERVASVIFGGLGLNMVRGLGGAGPVAHALEADSIDDVVNPTARTFRAFAERTGSDLKALAACIRSAKAPITAADVGALRCPALIVVGSDDVIGGSASDLAALIPGGEAVTLADRDHMKAVGDAEFKWRVVDWLDRDRSPATRGGVAG